MAFSYKHYVPVLRAKQAEWLALRNLAAPIRVSMTPLVELTPEVAESRPSAAARAGLTTFDHAVRMTLKNVMEEVKHGRVFFDLGHIRPQHAAAWTLIHDLCGGPTPGLVPVVTAGARDGRLRDLRIMTSGGVGACLRLSARVVGRSDVPQVLNTELEALQLSQQNVDLVVDLGCAPSAISHDRLRAIIPSIANWRSWTVLAGVFPVDLRDLDADQLEYRLPRQEWQVWQAQILAAGPRVRRPAFGDFTVQHGEYVPAPKVPGSLSVRYTLEEEFLVLRGRKPNAGIGVGFDQYHGHARYLTATSDYYGATFSAGDDFIKAKCATGSGPGDRRQWLAAGVNHHLTATVTQLRSPHL